MPGNAAHVHLPSCLLVLQIYADAYLNSLQDAAAALDLHGQMTSSAWRAFKGVPGTAAEIFRSLIVRVCAHPAAVAAADAGNACKQLNGGCIPCTADFVWCLDPAAKPDPSSLH